MMTRVPKLSIVCPACEEEAVLPLFHRALCAVLDELRAEYEIEILYVDDGSRDRTLPLLRTFAATDSRVRYLSFSRNFGHQAALTAGLEHAHGDLVVTLDSDLQHPPELIPHLLEKWHEGYEIVATIRADDPREGWRKRFTSRLFYRVLAWLSDTEVRFAAADFRLMSRKAVVALLQLRETHRFLRGMVQWLGFPTAEVPYQPGPRRAGVTKYTYRRMVGFALDALLSFSRVPLRLTVLLGLVSMGLGLILGGLFLVLGLLGKLELSGGIAAMLTSLHVLGGSILIGLGLVGEYVSRIYEQVKSRPLYLVKETSEEQRRAPRLPQLGSRLREVENADRFSMPAVPDTSRSHA